MKKLKYLYLLISYLSLVVLACEDNTEYSSDEKITQYTGIEISAPAYLFLGEALTAKVLLISTDGLKQEVNADEVTWLSGDTNIIMISGNGAFTGISEGSANILASYNEFTVSENISVADPAKFLINEIYYNTATDGSAFIELFNNSICAADISGYELLNSLNELVFRFPDGSIISAKSCVVVAESFDDFNNLFALFPDYSGFDSSLDNDSDTVLLCRNNTIKDIVYIKGGANNYPASDDWGSSDYPCAAQGKSVSRLSADDTNTYIDWSENDPTPGNN